MFWLIVIIWIIFVTRDSREKKSKDNRFEHGNYYGPASAVRNNPQITGQAQSTAQERAGAQGQPGAQGRPGTAGSQSSPSAAGRKRKSELLKIILGALSLLGGIDELGELIAGHFSGSEPIDLVMAAVLIGLGIGAIAVGLRNMKLYNICEGVIRRDGNTPIDSIAKAVRKPYDDTVSILSAMIRKNYFPNAYIDYQNRLLVMTKNGQPIEPVKPYEGAVCPHCSGPVEDDAVFCPHCGKRIKDEAAVKEAERQAAEKAKEEEKYHYLNELERLANEIDEQEFKSKMLEMKDVSRRIYDRIEEDPDSADSFRKFTNIYMPAIINAVETYRDVRSADCSIDETLESRQDALDAVDMGLSGARKILDQLYQTDQLNVAVDLEMLRRMMAADGLLQDDKMTMDK